MVESLKAQIKEEPQETPSTMRPTPNPEEQDLIAEQKKSEKITLSFRTAASKEVTLKVKRTVPFERIFKAVVQKLGSRSVEQHSFLFDGEIIYPENTPDSLDMEDEDQVDIMATQIGGRASS